MGELSKMMLDCWCKMLVLIPAVFKPFTANWTKLRRCYNWYSGMEKMSQAIVGVSSIF